MNKYSEAIQKLRLMNDMHNKVLEKNNLSGGFGNLYLGVKKVLEEAEKEYAELQKKEVPMKPIVVDYQPYCPVCHLDTYHGKGIMDKYTERYCSNCGQKLDWSEEDDKA